MNHLTSTKTISNEELNELPLGAFSGKIEVIGNEDKIGEALEEISQYDRVGFDTETKPVFVRGHHNKVALLQIAVPEKVFLIQLKETGITNEIKLFLQNPRIEKVGVAIRDDLKALQLLKRFRPEGFVELTTLTRAAGYEVESVKKLTALFLGFRISKSAQTSNWEAPQLDPRQLTYAATDAWVCLQIYDLIRSHQPG
ncbi:MAG: 3'-5' exonuclease [Cytophagales bacterium]|nr:3'-5' exonuclease [Cytophagales bacterium]